MKNVVDFFLTQSHDKPYIIQQKTKAIVWVSLIASLIIIVNMFIMVGFSESFSFKSYGVYILLISTAILNLFIIRSTDFK